ncbi:uncharacterized protein si:dkey-52l18.4 isoform X2 [Hoplias malabaricus]|uniref:uncharacterized protein si:dkey-52l18.4 isoform X2 n=1 Tax=Hoplias malabaricus TaxID=27720 RepID=UPI0034621A6C
MMPNVLLSGPLIFILVFSCNFQACLSESNCKVRANRSTQFVPEGGSITLQCNVLDCGHNAWTGGWGLTERGHFIPLISSQRLQMSNNTLSANSTQLLLQLINLSQSDSGGYMCEIDYEGGVKSRGHITYLNVTAGSYENITKTTYRRLSDRLLVCAASSLCFPLLLGLTYCLYSKCLRAPPVPPRVRGTYTVRVKPKAEVTYATVILKSPRHETRSQTGEPIIYSSVNFSTV